MKGRNKAHSMSTPLFWRVTSTTRTMHNSSSLPPILHLFFFALHSIVSLAKLVKNLSTNFRITTKGSNSVKEVGEKSQSRHRFPPVYDVLGVDFKWRTRRIRNMFQLLITPCWFGQLINSFSLLLLSLVSVLCANQWKAIKQKANKQWNNFFFFAVLIEIFKYYLLLESFSSWPNARNLSAYSHVNYVTLWRIYATLVRVWL